jgi:UPF0755 protein
MSRDGYERWDERPDAADPDGYDGRGGRRSHRARRDDQWQPDPSQDPYRGEGSHRRSGQHSEAGAADPGYGDAGYADPGYADSGYPESGYPESGYPVSGYADPGYRGPGYDAPGYSDAGYGDAGHDGYGQPAGYEQTAGYPEGYRDAAYPADGYTGAYGGADAYGVRPGYGEQDPVREPARYDTGDPYASRDSRGRRGTPQAGYDAPASAQYGGGYDEHDYGWQDPVDEPGVAPRRPRDPEDELDPDSARHNGFFRGFGAPDDSVGHRPPRRKRSAAGIVALVILIVFVVGIVGGGAYAYKWYSNRHADWTGSAGHGSVVVRVLPGEVACSATMENLLVNDGVVASGSAFCSAAKADGDGAALEPGYFTLHKHMGAALAWALIISPKSRVQTKVAVPDGMRASKIIALLAAKTGIPLSQFQAALKNTSALGLPSWANGNPEGFLWPATYSFQPGDSALSMLQTMVKQANTEFASLDLPAKAKAAQFTEYQVVIAASLLEGEVPPQYYTKVARVIDNRLNQSPPWKLGLDSTVAYAVNKYVYNLSQSDLNVNSPYNTTLHTGLPPGPINSPDVAAIDAVLHPAQGSWLYFVTVNKKGLTLFTSDASQFDSWSTEAKNNGV